VVFVYDADANKPSDSFGSVKLLSYEKIEDAYCEKGVENLLPEHVFTDDMYQRIEKPSGYGRPTVVYEPRKTDLCEALCGEGVTVETFENFRPTLELIQAALVDLGVGQAPQPTASD
ncbi:MAG: hypothetical protein SW019_11485, partial [Actinomycetota bacterium]|nr:hypothetical protein [Actinomycetota bacterium]